MKKKTVIIHSVSCTRRDDEVNNKYKKEKEERIHKREDFFFLHYQLLFDVLSTNSIVYLDGDVADLICNEGNKRKFDQNHQNMINNRTQK